MEAEKSHYLQSANWKLREVDGINSSLSLKAWEPGALMVWVPVQGQEKTAVSALTVRKRRSAFPPPFCSTQTLKGLDDAQPHWQMAICFVQFTHSNANLSW